MCGGGFGDMILATTTLGQAHFAIEQGKQAEEAARMTGESINRQAGQEQDAAQAQAQIIRLAAQRQRAEAAATFSASGVSVDAGTPLKIDEAIARGGESDALATIITGARRGASLSDQAAVTINEGINAKRAGYVKAGTILADGAKQAAGSSSGWKG